MRVGTRLGWTTTLIALAIGVAWDGPARATSVDFEVVEGYGPGNLFGQPSPGNAWVGDDTAKIVVTNAVSQSGAQAVRLDPSVDSGTGRKEDHLDVGRLPRWFRLRFFWRPSGTAGGDAVVFLSQFATIGSAVGPLVQFVGGGSAYQIKYVSGGFVGNIKLGMDPAIYEDQWWEVEIVGDLSTQTFDFYLDGVLEASGLGFRHTAPSNRATELHFLGLQVASTGATIHAFDAFQTGAAPGPVPTGSPWSVGVTLVALVGSALWLLRVRAPREGR
jgi:hypothetical protein